MHAGFHRGRLDLRGDGRGPESGVAFQSNGFIRYRGFPRSDFLEAGRIGQATSREDLTGVQTVKNLESLVEGRNMLMLLSLTDNRHQWATIRSEGCRSFICTLIINKFFMRIEKEGITLHICKTTLRLSNQFNVNKTINIIFRSINSINFSRLSLFHLQNITARSHNDSIRHNHIEILKYWQCSKHSTGIGKLKKITYTTRIMSSESSHE